MAQNTQLTTKSSFLRFASVLACLSAFSLLPIPQLSVMMYAESAETESPSQEDGETFEEELVVEHSARRRLNNRRYNHTVKIGNRTHKIAFKLSYLPAIVGHLLSNSITAPRLI